MLAIVDLYRMIDKNAGGALDGVSQKPACAVPRVLARADGLTGQKPPEAGADAEPHDRAPRQSGPVVNKGVAITQSWPQTLTVTRSLQGHVQGMLK
jgi:hypothetical protein